MTNSPNNETIGLISEHIAHQYLIENGYAIIERNWRKPWGEIDIIARKGMVIVFVEVKGNRIHRDGFNPELRANQSKMTKVIRTAQSYLLSKNYPDTQEWRIDVISVIVGEGNTCHTIKHFENIDCP